jgi:transposase
MTQLKGPPIPDATTPPVIIGVDWADKAHAVCLIDSLQPKPQHSELSQKSEDIAAWATELRQKYPGRELHVILEQSRGALFHAFLAMGCFTLFPINPKQLARYREAVYPSGGKNDPDDAELLARFLLNHPDQVRPSRPDSEQTRRLAHLTELRRRVVEERKRVTLQLASTLKVYFPCVLELFDDRLDQPVVTKLIQRWSTLSELQRAKPSHLEAFLKEHGIKGEDRRRELCQAVRSAVPLTKDPAILEPYALLVQGLARQLEELVRSVAEFNDQIEEAVRVHEDTPLFKPLPGAGDVLIPRLIVAFGSDRDRYESADQIQNYSGIAPVTEQSGKSRHVTRRRACPKFLHQTFHEFADHSRRWSRWAKVWYEHKKAQGMKHNAAVRALAFKWIRILFRLWKDRKPYSEERYIQSLIKANSPVAQFLKNS